MAPDTSTGAALSASLSLVALQIGSRLFSFGLNQLLLRATSPDAFGVATIQLDTLLATLLFFLREGLRGAVAVRHLPCPLPLVFPPLTSCSTESRPFGERQA